jgi:ABC-type branched-subunit amino acid transport system substrate-binding protein
MRKIIAAGAVALFALTACTTKKDAADTTEAPATTSATTSASTDTGSTTPTGSTITDPRAQGVTDTEVKIGITLADLSTVKDLIGYDQGDAEAAYQAVIDEVNANGGVNGRKLVPVYAPVNPNTSDGPSAACTKLAQDEKVFVALGFVLGDDALCYVDTNETILIGGEHTNERMGKAKVAWFTTEPGERQQSAGVQALVENGKIGEKLAILGTAGNESAYEGSIKPILEAAGVTPIDVAYVDASSGDAETIYSQEETIAERFKADGVEQVLIIDSGLAVTLPVGLGRSSFRPQLLFSNVSGASGFISSAGADLSLLEGALTGGVYDSSNDFLTLGGPTADCVANQTAAGLELKHDKDYPKTGASKQYQSSLVACRNIALLVAILEKAGPELNYGTFTAAGYSLGEITLAGVPDAFNFGPGDGTDGNPPVYVYEFDPATNTMVRQGG